MPRYVRLILLTGPVAEVDAAQAGHDEQVHGLRAAGKLIGAGRLRRGAGYVEVFDAADLHEAERLVAADPFVAGGLATWMLRELEQFE